MQTHRPRQYAAFAKADYGNGDSRKADAGTSEPQRSIDRIGNNLNQIAHRANAAGVLEKSEWDRTTALMTALKEEIQKWR